MADLSETADTSDDKSPYSDPKADGLPDAGPRTTSQWLDLHVPDSRASIAKATSQKLLDGVVQSEVVAGRLPTDAELENVKAAYVAYMNLAYVGARYDQLALYVAEARKNFSLMQESEAETLEVPESEVLEPNPEEPDVQETEVAEVEPQHSKTEHAEPHRSGVQHPELSIRGERPSIH